jgi:hypothetical protein
MNLFENIVDLNVFNNYLIKNGGRTSIKSNVSKITMRQFIFKLIKTFRKDFNKKKRGGVANINDTPISNISNISDLSFAQYTFSPRIELVRDIY